MSLEIEFSGICGFVPVLAQKKVWVLLVNAFDPTRMPGKPPKVPRAHHARVMYRVGNVHPAAPPGEWSLTGCDLEIECLRGGVGLVEGEGRSVPDTAEEERWFSWVPQLQGSHSKVFSDCIAADPQEVPGFVGSRVLLEGGTLGTGVVVRERSPHYKVVRFKFGDRDDTALAETVLLKADVSTVTLKRTHHKSLRVDRLTLTGKPIRLYVMNLELPPVVLEQQREEIEEFRWFYALSADRKSSGEPRPPFPVPVLAGVIGNPYCPVARLDP